MYNNKYTVKKVNYTSKSHEEEFKVFVDSLYESQNIELKFREIDWIEMKKDDPLFGLRMIRDKTLTFSSKMHLLAFFRHYPQFAQSELDKEFLQNTLDKFFGKGVLEKIYQNDPINFTLYVLNPIGYFASQLENNIDEFLEQNKNSDAIAKITIDTKKSVQKLIENQKEIIAKEISKESFEKEKSTYFLKPLEKNTDEYMKQMIAYAFGQSQARDKNLRQVSKAYLIKGENQAFVQTSHPNFEHLSRYLVNTEGYEALAEKISSQFGIKLEDAKKYIIAMLKKEYLSCDIKTLISDDQSNLVYDALNPQSIIADSIKSGKLKIISDDGEIKEVAIDYDSLAKAAMLIAVLGDYDGIGKYLTNMGAHIENDKIYFHKIDFGRILLNPNLTEIKVDENNNIIFNIPEIGKVMHGNRFAQEIFSNIPQEYLKKAAIDILSAIGEPLDGFLEKLQTTNDVIYQNFALQNLSETLNLRLKEFEDMIKPILSQEELQSIEKSQKMELTFPKKPSRDLGTFIDTKQATEMGASGGKIFTKKSGKENTLLEERKNIEEQRLKMQEFYKKAMGLSKRFIGNNPQPQKQRDSQGNNFGLE